jgi:Ca2+-binding RTX toxin-like protein
MNDQAGPLNKETRFDFTNASGQRPSISLDEKFSYTIDAYGDTLQVTVRADGQIYTSTSHISAVWNTDAFYFKAGVYLGVNSGTGAGQASFYALNVSHSRTPATSTPPLAGTDGDDVIRGTAASERLDGGDGRNTVLGLGGNDLLLSGSGTDRLSGGDGADRLQSGGGRDALSGGSGRDLLVGGLGQDSLTGGSGADRFRFDDRDTGAARSRADTILDFRGNVGDRIDLRRIDADTSTSRDDAFTFVGTAEFTGAGQVRYQKSSTDTWILLNTDADSSPEAVIRLKGAMDISEGWLLY